MSNAAPRFFTETRPVGLSDEIVVARQILVEALPAIEACRRPHHGLDVDWLLAALVGLLDVAREAVATLEGVRGWEIDVERIKQARPAAVEAVAWINTVVSQAAGLTLPLEACPCPSYPEELLRQWHLAGALLEAALCPVYDREDDAGELVPEELARRVAKACVWARQSWRRWCGVGCPCPDCSVDACQASERGERVAETPATVRRRAAAANATRAPGSPVRISTPASLSAGLVLAQEHARALAKDGRMDNGTAYVSAAATLGEAKPALALGGLAVTVLASKLVRLVDERGPLGLRRTYRVSHAGGAVQDYEQEWPLGALDALPTAANLAAASVSATKRFLVDLLLIATREDEEPDGRKSPLPQGAARARKVREVIALLPSYQRHGVEDALDRGIGNETTLARLHQWALDMEPVLLAARSRSRLSSVVPDSSFLDTPAGAPAPATPTAGTAPATTANDGAAAPIPSPPSGEAPESKAAVVVSVTVADEGVVEPPEGEGAAPVLGSVGLPAEAATPSASGALGPEVAPPTRSLEAMPETEGVGEKAAEGNGRAPVDPEVVAPREEGTKPPEGTRTLSALEVEVERLKKAEAEDAAKKEASTPAPEPIRELAAKAVRRRPTKVPPYSAGSDF